MQWFYIFLCLGWVVAVSDASAFPMPAHVDCESPYASSNGDYAFVAEKRVAPTKQYASACLGGAVCQTKDGKVLWKVESDTICSENIVISNDGKQLIAGLHGMVKKNEALDQVVLSFYNDTGLLKKYAIGALIENPEKVVLGVYDKAFEKWEMTDFFHWLSPSQRNENFKLGLSDEDKVFVIRLSDGSIHSFNVVTGEER